MTLTSDDMEGQGIGLYNVLHRLRLFYGNGLTMQMENNDPAGGCIRIVYHKGGTKDVSSSDCG